MKYFVIRHRKLGEPNSWEGVLVWGAENEKEALQHFYEAYEDLPYYIEDIFKLSEEGILYWVYFREVNLFHKESIQKMGLRVKPYYKTVRSAFEEYFGGIASSLDIIEYEIAPSWLQN